MDGMKGSNPKDAIGADKIPYHLWPEIASAYGSLGMLEGALKYGRSNYRAIGVKASIYYDAARRHLAAWFEGEEVAPDSGIPHLGHALACLAIIVDAQAAGKFIDDRMIKGGYQDKLAELTPNVPRLKEKYQDKDPKHYTIQDNPISEELQEAIETAFVNTLATRMREAWGQPVVSKDKSVHIWNPDKDKFVDAWIGQDRRDW